MSYPAPRVGILPSAMENEIVRKLTWSAMLTVSSALASLLAARLAAIAYRRFFNEDPPE